MAFWLAQERNGQYSDYIQRFDPRFWTVNFPRPMMASVITETADSLRVDCEFHHAGELCGLIWDSEDLHDHPLLRYETDRDYSHTVLNFHWQSNGFIPLDQPNGPTLTIEGRDASGTARTWYVRLWNYASGTPSSADISLPFSELQSGYGLPGEPVAPADIDRMFISLVPVGYQPGSTEPLGAAANAFVTLTRISCEGHRSMLEIGDVIVPPHEEKIATAYDDSYNLTPQRVLRNAQGLGYRGRILHYVGMSHYFRLVTDATGSWVATSGYTICTPAFRWHNAFFGQCAALGYEVICSLSYELFADHCPPAWQQIAFDGEPGRTGWVPPSALLSPANSEAMNWLKMVAQVFVQVMRMNKLPILFQIGEPWWWITPDKKPCIYDAAAIAEFGGDPPIIEDMRDPLDSAQKQLLDDAGTLLAQSTTGLTEAIRQRAGGAAEVMLLAFTPTILDPEMPELKRANVPLGWASPAFDRLQLEDYDWLTDGANALRRLAYDEFDRRLGYPVSRQDYLSGFVLNAANAEAYWPRIDAALDEAAERGVTDRYVWASPQINRDGYTRLAATKDTVVQAFDDVLYPLALGTDTGVTPEFSTTVATTASGHERRNSLWSDARLKFDVGPGIRSERELGVLIAFFRARRGAARGFRLTDPFDFSSNEMTGSPTMFDQSIGTGDGTTSDFALTKNYGAAEDPQTRKISRPRVETVTISIDGNAATEWTVSSTGIVTFVHAPPTGAIIKAGFLFDVPVRFAEDALNITGVNFAAGEAPSVPLIEIREAS